MVFDSSPIEMPAAVVAWFREFFWTVASEKVFSSVLLFVLFLSALTCFAGEVNSLVMSFLVGPVNTLVSI